METTGRSLRQIARREGHLVPDQRLSFQLCCIPLLYIALYTRLRNDFQDVNRPYPFLHLALLNRIKR